jgi:hypothetical protein
MQSSFSAFHDHPRHSLPRRSHLLAPRLAAWYHGEMNVVASIYIVLYAIFW